MNSTSCLFSGTSNSRLLHLLSKLCILKPYLASLVFLFFTVLSVFSVHRRLLTSLKFLALISCLVLLALCVQLPQPFETFSGLSPFIRHITLSGGKSCTTNPQQIEVMEFERYRTVRHAMRWIVVVTISIPSLPHSFIPGLKPSFSANPSHRSLFFFFRLTPRIPRTVYRYFWAYPFFSFLFFSVFHFVVVGSVR